MPLEFWTTAVVFASIAEEVIVRALDTLLLEKTLVVCGRDLDMVSKRYLVDVRLAEMPRPLFCCTARRK